jgi:hypothetical protein
MLHDSSGTFVQWIPLVLDAADRPEIHTSNILLVVVVTPLPNDTLPS